MRKIFPNQKIVSLFAMLVAGFGLTACNEGHLEPVNARVNYGNVYIGTSKTMSNQWSNTGGETVELSGLRTRGDDPAFFSPGNFTSHDVPPSGTSSNLLITFSPLEARQYKAKARPIGINKGTNPRATLDDCRLVGLGIAQSQQGSLQLVAPAGNPQDALDFGNVQVPGGSAIQTISLTNKATAPLTVQARWVDGTKGFSVVNPAAAQFNMPANSSTAISIQFAPSGPGPFSDAVEFEGTGAGAGSLAGIAVKGTGVREQ